MSGIRDKLKRKLSMHDKNRMLAISREVCQCLIY